MNIEVDKTLLDSIPPDHNFTTEPLLFIRKIEKIKDKGKISHRVLLATLFGIYLYKNKFFKKKMELAEQFSWDQVREISSPEEGEVLIKYTSGQLHFREREASLIILLILRNMVMVFQPSELPTFTLGQNVPSPDYNGDFLPQYKRFLYKCKQYNREPDAAILKSLDEYSKEAKVNADHGKNEFDMSKIKGFEPFADIIFESLDVCPYIKTIIVPLSTEHKLWNPLANFMRRNSIVTRLTIIDDISDGFTNFVQAVIQNPNSRLQSITFQNTIVKPKSFKLLNDLMLLKPVVQINFDKSVEKFRPFINIFARMKSFSAIRFLTISGVKGASPKLALKHLPKLLRIDFSYNDIDITPTIKEMVTLKHSRIREIICSGNYCKMLPQRKMKLPRKFSAFKATNVNWIGNNLLSFIKIFSRNSKRPDIKWAIDLSNATVESEAWMLFFQRIPDFPIQFLSVFMWDNNPIMPGFFDFLAGSKFLSNISLTGCLTPNDDSIQLFARFITANKSIRKLTLSGTDDKKLLGGMQTVIESLYTKRISVLDIQNNGVQDELFTMLQKFLQNNRFLTDLYIDKNNFQSVDKFREFIAFLKSRKSGINVQPPRNDLSDISSRDKSVRKGQILEIIQDLRVISNYKVKNNVVKSAVKKSGKSKSTKASTAAKEGEQTTPKEGEQTASKDEEQMPPPPPKSGSQEDFSNASDSAQKNAEEEEVKEAFEDMPNADNLNFSDSSSGEEDNETDDHDKETDDHDKETSDHDNGEEEDTKDDNDKGEEEEVREKPSIVQVAALRTSLAPVAELPPDSLPAVEEEKTETTLPGQWSSIGAPSWDNVEKLFIDDSMWMSKFRPAPADASKIATAAFRKDFGIQRLLLGLRQK